MCLCLNTDTGASVRNTAQLASVSKGCMTKVISAFISMGKSSVNRAGKHGWQHIFDDPDACALVWYCM